MLCLSSQVRVLLIELEEARGNHVIHEEEVSSADVSSTSEVISQHLVTFRSVEELQKQNQRLLVALRELSDAQEKEEFETTGNKYVQCFMFIFVFFVCYATCRLELGTIKHKSLLMLFDILTFNYCKQFYT